MQRLFGITAVVFLTACAGTPFNWEDTEKVKLGMSEAEVIAILGKPYLRKQTENAIVLAWGYTPALGGGRAVSFRFVDGKVVGSSTANK